MQLARLVVVVAVSSVLHKVSSFCIQRPSTSRSKTELRAKKNFLAPVAVATLGWTLASQIAAAGLIPASNEQVFHEEPSVLIAEYEKLDFSMPTYGSDTSGFGMGSEAFLGGNSDNLEQQKQAEAMRKAEAARKARIAAKNEERKMQEAANKERAIQKKAQDAARVKELFQ